MPVKSRDELKKAFRKGCIPSEEDFFNLIDSLSHINDDDYYDNDNGLKLTSFGSSNKMITFLNNFEDKFKVWTVEKYDSHNKMYGLTLNDLKGESVFSISLEGNIGIGTKKPSSKLDVNGDIKYCGRKGNYASGKIVADGKWHTVIDELKDCHAFEVVAKMSRYHTGVHSILYALALNSFNGKCKNIKTIDSYYNSFMDKIELRWEGETYNYRLEMRSKKDQGNEVFIKYNIGNLWWE